jgi:hypothetical protein
MTCHWRKRFRCRWRLHRRSQGLLIPSGLFSPAGDSTIPPEARAIFAGHVLAADEKVNVLTGRTFILAFRPDQCSVSEVIIIGPLMWPSRSFRCGAAIFPESE